MKYISICSGIEAATVAWHPLGWKPLAFSEIEAFPSAVLAYHYPTVPNLGDMTKFYEWDIDLLAQADILVGGTPCQAFSVAGLRAGLDDARGQLTLTYIKLLDHIDNLRSYYGKQPAICVWENVPGVLSSKDNAFGAFLGGLAGEDCELLPSGGKWTDAGCVYGPKRSVAWRVLDAQYFGLAQRRKRVFVIASAGNFDPSEILFEFDGVRRDTPPSRETGKSSTEAVGGSSQSSYSVIADPTPKVGDDICLTMRSQGGGGIVPPSVAVYREGSFGQYSDDGTFATSFDSGGSLGGGSESFITIPIHDKATCHGGERGVSNGLGIGSPTDPCPPLDTGGNHAVAFSAGNSAKAHGIGYSDQLTPPLRSGASGTNQVPIIGFSCKDYGNDAMENMSPCLRSMGHNGSHQNGGGQVAVCLMDQGGSVMNVENNLSVPLRLETHGHEPSVVCPTQMQVRRLTPVECERLQGFGDGYTDVPFRNKPAADGNRYKALGNSMATKVMKWIGERINERMG